LPHLDVGEQQPDPCLHRGFAGGRGGAKALDRGGLRPLDIPGRIQQRRQQPQ
jgi:hypothetical protein